MAKVPPAVAELRSRIGELTGRVPSSRKESYLRSRLTTIEARIGDGHDVRHRNDAAKAFSVSMPARAYDALQRVLEKEKTKASPLVREALANECRSKGYHEEAAIIGGSDD